MSSINLLPMPPSTKSDFGIHAFDSVIRVQSSSAEIGDLLDRYIFPPLPRCGAVPDGSDIDLVVQQSENETQVLINGELAGVAASGQDAALLAVKALDAEIVQRLKRYRAVHAGAVLLDQRALLIPGSTHAGKSSLVAELLRRGASCLSDEYALIGDDGRVHAYPRPLLLRNGRPEQSLFLPDELGSSFAACPAEVGWIVAVDYAPAGEWALQPQQQSEAVMLLLRNTPHEMAESPDLVNFFLPVAAKAKCYRGTRGEAHRAVEHILDLVKQK